MARSSRTAAQLVPERTLTKESGQPTEDRPLDLAADAFAPAALPWQPEGALASPAPLSEPFSVGDAVRLVREPPAWAALPSEALRKFGPLAGELFEVVALTIPGQLAISRRVQHRGEAGLQTLFVPVDCVEAVDFAPSRQMASPEGRVRDVPADFDDDDFAPCDSLAGFKLGDCARLVRLPRDVRRLPRRERREFQALLGERFEVFALSRADNEVHLARNFDTDSGLPGIEVFIMPIDCIEPAEFDPEPEEEEAEPVVH